MIWYRCSSRKRLCAILEFSIDEFFFILSFYSLGALYVLHLILVLELFNSSLDFGMVGALNNKYLILVFVLSVLGGSTPTFYFFFLFSVLTKYQQQINKKA